MANNTMAKTAEYDPIDSLRFTEDGVPSGFILISVHLRVLHSNPYRPSIPKPGNSIGMNDKSQAAATINFALARNFP